ncbi:MAG: TetR/AcrR family transcriptional regulator [candidate division Zixibacteria bacterium]|nr:TetR/AcrR family transcriptional regulator [candidate division Zixibacteria bacterium]
MAPKVIDRQQKKRQIIYSAMQVFARQGINNFKMIDIARKANLGKGTLYEYFRSKEELIAGTFELFMETYSAYITNELNKHENPEVKIKVLIASSLDFFVSHEEWVAVMFDFWAAGSPRREGKSFITGLAGFYEKYKNYLVALLDEGINKKVFHPVDKPLMASVIIALLDGVMFQVLMGLLKNEPRLGENISRLVLQSLISSERITERDKGD